MTGSETTDTRRQRDDRRAILLLLGVFSLLYAYFFQGGGWNQNSHFDTIRALVERHTMEISPFAANTGDIGVFEQRVYANKPPGLAFWGAPFYFVIYHLERAFGVPWDTPLVINANAHLLTIVTSGVPAAVLVVFLYLSFRRQGAGLREALGLAGGFGTGSLLLPYSGVMMNHALAACLLFGAWYLISASRPGRHVLLAGGLLAGMAVLTEFVTAPAVGVFVGYLLWKHRSKEIISFLIGGAVMAGVLLLRNYFSFGSALVTNYSIQSTRFTGQGLLLGMLDWPQPIRLLWLTVHPFRGLFYCCPIFLICVLPFVPPRRALPITAEAVVAGLVVVWFFLVNMSFNGWTGGWAIGPRYLIPALPFLFSFALPGFRRFPRLSGALIALSTTIMVGATAVRVMIPSPNSGPPPAFNPVAYCFRQLIAGNVSISTQSMLESVPTASAYDAWDSYNLGEVIGLAGPTSLIPVGLLLLVFARIALRVEPAAPRDPGGDQGRP